VRRAALCALGKVTWLPQTYIAVIDIMVEYLGGCLLLLAGAVVGWWASRRYEGRKRRIREGKPSFTLDATAGHSAAAEERDTTQVEPTIPREWDGGPLRPDLNRQVSLARGLR
jgi:hypothetical protein